MRMHSHRELRLFFQQARSSASPVDFSKHCGNSPRTTQFSWGSSDVFHNLFKQLFRYNKKHVTLGKVRGFQRSIPAASPQKPPGAVCGRKAPPFPRTDLKGQSMHKIFITFAVALFTVLLFTYLETEHLCMFCKLS